ncbi:hypothetical protein J3A83DRAFT_4184577 [Scleroderma citrinum]
MIQSICHKALPWYHIKRVKSGIVHINCPRIPELPPAPQIRVSWGTGMVPKVVQRSVEMTSKTDSWALEGDKTIRCQEHGKKDSLRFKYGSVVTERYVFILLSNIHQTLEIHREFLEFGGGGEVLCCMTMAPGLMEGDIKRDCPVSVIGCEVGNRPFDMMDVRGGDFWQTLRERKTVVPLSLTPWPADVQAAHEVIQRTYNRAVHVLQCGGSPDPMQIAFHINALSSMALPVLKALISSGTHGSENECLPWVVKAFKQHNVGVPDLVQESNSGQQGQPQKSIHFEFLMEAFKKHKPESGFHYLLGHLHHLGIHVQQKQI